ncbi:tetratricopeptide repeat protein [Thermodesulfobacteriota bacterium]
MAQLKRFRNCLLAISAFCVLHGCSDATNDLQKGIEALRRGEYDLSIELTTKAINSKKFSSEILATAYFNRGLARMLKQEFNMAIGDFTKALEINPRDVVAYGLRGEAYFEKRQFNKSHSDFTKALTTDPMNAIAYNQLAWFLATCPEARYRDGYKAVELARRAVEINEKDEEPFQPLYEILDTMAAAYAEVGEFDKAIATQKKAIALAKKELPPEDMKDFETHRHSYKANKPWRER